MRRFLAPLVGWWVALAVLLGSTSAEAAPLRRALVIGANDGGTDLDPLRYARLDATRTAELLAELGDFDEVEVLLEPEVAEIEAALGRAAATTAEGGLFLFYYSGHADARGLRLRDQIYPFTRLKADIRDVPAELHLGVFDACRSGAVTRLKGAAMSEPFLDASQPPAEGEAWLAASTEDEDAQESDRLRGSFFTHYLLSGLRGAADTGDGVVSLSEAYEYAYARTVSRTSGTSGGTQHPAYAYEIQGNGQLELTRVSRATAKLRIPAGVSGSIVVVRIADEVPFAEIHAPGGRPVELAVPPDTYLLRRRDGRDLRAVRVVVHDRDTVVVDDWTESVAELTVRKGDGSEEHVSAVITDSFWVQDLQRDAERFGLDVARAVTDTSGPGYAAAWSIVPGAGQFTSRRWGPGIAFMGATVGSFALAEGVRVATDPKSPAFTQDPLLFDGDPRKVINPLHMLGFALWGWAMADAVHGAVGELDDDRPITGFTLSYASAWQVQDFGHVYVHGLSFDWHPAERWSIGIDRLGWPMSADGERDLTLAARATYGLDLDRVRIAGLASLGFRLDADEGEALPTVGLGGQLRVYPAPRYFLELDTRVQLTGDRIDLLPALAMGVHFGR